MKFADDNLASHCFLPSSSQFSCNLGPICRCRYSVPSCIELATSHKCSSLILFRNWTGKGTDSLFSDSKTSVIWRFFTPSLPSRTNERETSIVIVKLDFNICCWLSITFENALNSSTLCTTNKCIATREDDCKCNNRDQLHFTWNHQTTFTHHSSYLSKSHVTQMQYLWYLLFIQPLEVESAVKHIISVPLCNSITSQLYWRVPVVFHIETNNRWRSLSLHDL